MKRSRNCIRVVKLGGSLLTRPDVDHRLADWLQFTATEGRAAIVVGGGQLIDVMRSFDQRWPLDAEAMHWRCVELLRYTMEIIADRMPQLKSIRDVDGLDEWRRDADTSRDALVDVNAFYRKEDADSRRLPSSWKTTTDSIAALLAFKLEAESLTLLKSCSPPIDDDWVAASRAGIVDDAFPEAIEGLSNVKIVDLTKSSC
ncbi:MAG: hypothetical protein R3C05_00440 [Pirellulaceae bacterium]